MKNEVNLRLKNLNVNSIMFYKCLLLENSNDEQTIEAQNGYQLFEIIDKQFNELKHPDILVQLLDVLHLTIQQSPTSTCQLMYKSIKNLLTQHTANEQDYLIALHLLKQFLCSVPNDFLINDDGLIREIFRQHCDNVKVQSHLAMCLCILVEKFKMTSLLHLVWEEIQSKKASSLMVNYIDALITQCHIYRRSEFWQLVETFLLADTDRKMAIFVIRKVLGFLTTTKEDVKVDRYFQWPEDNVLASWLAYLTILENLEEKQSHLILPALQMVKNVHLGEKMPWTRILFQQMLRHKNNLVLRWSVNYLYSNFSEMILENGILEDFLLATNNTWLYIEMKPVQITSFQCEDIDYFMKVFSDIPWKSVPMHAWLMTMRMQMQVKDVTFKTITGIAARIRQLQNRLIRCACRDIFVDLFESRIEDLSLKDFMSFLDAFYSSSDRLSLKLLSLLMSQIEQSSEPFLSYNVFTILSQQDLSPEHQAIIIKKLLSMESRYHQWFSILLVFFFEDEIENYTKAQLIKKLYGFEISSRMFEQLSWNDVSKAVIRQLTVDSYAVEQLPEFMKDGDFEDRLHTGGLNTLLKLTDTMAIRFQLTYRMLNALVGELRSLSKRNVVTSEIVKNVLVLCRRDQPSYFYEYTNEILDIDSTNIQLAFNVFDNCLPECNLNEANGRKLLIRGLLFGESLTGDARLEYDYAVRMGIPNLDSVSSYKVREVCLKYLTTLDFTHVQLLQIDLIDLSKVMSTKKPRYFENSKHHRLKLRIAQALTVLNSKSNFSWHDYYLDAIFHENNQTNVTYMFEFIVATSIGQQELIQQMEQLHKLSTSCQSSMIAISFLFCRHHKCDDELIGKLIAFILPWTMGSNFNTRTHAQMAVYHLIKRFKIEKFNHLQIAIEKGLQESTNAIEKLNTDLRFTFPDEISFADVAEPILFVTTVPEDECPSSKLNRFCKIASFKEARRLNMLKREPSNAQETNTIIEDVQRKMNPEIFSCDNLSSNQLSKNKFDMIVIASLIDKLPNLGGIARTCEVLGIKELVMNSVKHTQNKEFKNLSMTAENWINVIEVQPKSLKNFLTTKQIEGYKVVGAEQTSNSVNFMEFEFPEKCVILLGHEKEGIPSDLIALLDYAVEIPQFGMVRSLNVHVTGALFMYEYCKQRVKSLKGNAS